jgi:hypothetical protein
MGFFLPAVGCLPWPAPFLLIEAVKHLHAPVYPNLRVKNGYLRQGLCRPSLFVHFLWHSRLHVADNGVLDDGCHVK